MRFVMWCLPRGSGEGGVTARGALCVSVGPPCLLDLLLLRSSLVGEWLLCALREAAHGASSP